MGINDKILIAGAGGFIGGALVALLRKQGYRDLRAVDMKPFEEWYQRFEDVENLSLDLNLKENCDKTAAGAVEIYNLAANMGDALHIRVARKDGAPIAALSLPHDLAVIRSLAGSEG